MNTIPTYRRGRRIYTPGEKRTGPCEKILSSLVLLLFLILPPLVFYKTENNRHLAFTSLSETLDMNIKELPTASTTPLNPGDAVHGSPNMIDATTYDPDMGIRIPDSLLLSRDTEYCQWQEIRRESCETCSRPTRDENGNTTNEAYQCNCVTTFDYVKSWTTHRINSMFFDQPAAHHNPQRDPMPRTSFASNDAVVEFSDNYNHDHDHDHRSDKTITAELSPLMIVNGIRGAKARTIKWVRDGIPPVASFFFRWIPDRSRYEDLYHLSDQKLSYAALEDNFVYVGDGYFFSPNRASRQNQMFKYFMQYIEGTLFDWQIGDLMPSCEAGDVRIRYSVQDPTDVSILGQVSNNVQKSNNVVASAQFKIQPIRTTNGRDVGLIHQGYHTAQEMIIAEDRDSILTACIFRTMLLVWSVVISRFVGSRVFDMNLSKAKLPTQIGAALSVWCGLSGIVWIYIWGTQVDGTMMLVASSLFAFFVRQFPPSRNVQMKEKTS